MKINETSITKKIIITIMMVILFITILLVKFPSFAETSASEDSNVLYLKLSEFMTQDEPHMGYAIGNPATNGNVGNNDSHHIWNIVQTTKQDAEAIAFLTQRRNRTMEILNVLRSNNIASATTANTNQNIYCVNAETGFNDVGDTATYDVSYDMLTQRNEIKTKLQSLVEDEIPVDENGSTKIKKYDAVLALLDMLYLNDGEDLQTSEKEKEKFLEQAGIIWSEIFEQYHCEDGSDTYSWQKLLTNDDIKAVQQAAIWYFTNYYNTDIKTTQLSESPQEHYNKYDKTNAKGWLNYKLEKESENGKEYTSLSDYHTNDNPSEGKERQEQAEVLYKYLIKTAKANANKYSNVGTSTQTEEENAPVKLETKELQYKAKGDKYIIGPMKITENESNNGLYTLTMEVKNDNTPIDEGQYDLLNQNQTKEENKTLESYVGNDFYISIPKTSAKGTVKVSFTIKYNSKKMTLWTSQNSANSTQPVVIPETEEHTVTEELEVQPKEFDLALRKYITEVDGKALTNGDSREPNIDCSALNEVVTEADSTSKTTATYNHRKDPVEVHHGSKVTYKITIYNEGEKKGRATKIVDQLPTGLKFSSVKSGNFKQESYDEQNGNKLTLKRNDENNTDLNAYDKNGSTEQEKLSSETIEIVCEVTAIAGEEDSILTNVAWIAEAYDSESKVTITSNKGEDRDSEPGTLPKSDDQELDKNSLVNTDSNNYKGDISNENVSSEKDKYWKGQQDDDDFEKLILKKAKGKYDLKIIKVDDDNPSQKLSGAKFNVTVPGETDKRTETTDVNGEINISPINITEGGTDTITIEETQAPEGYKKLIGTLTLQVTKINDNGVYKATEVTIQEQPTTVAQATVNNGVVEVTIQNKKITGNYNLKIVKVDSTNKDKKLSGAEFKITLPEGVMAEDENEIIKTTDEQGVLEITDIKITDIKTNDTITIEEIQAPRGYAKIIDTLTLTVTKTQVGEEYKATGVQIENAPVNGATAKVENGVVQLDVENRPLYFDLALRKYITEVNGESVKDSRDPQIKTEDLESKEETTATYNHRKNPVEVAIGDEVTYKITVYNEGEIAGRATEITDQLPTGLVYIEDSIEGNYEVKTYDKDTNKLIIQRKDETNIDAYTSGKLESDTVTFKCKVQGINVLTDKVLTNVAWISEDANEIGEITDRDSLPSLEPEVDKDNMEDYKGNEENKEVTPEDDNYFWKGQQDDDDFEKLVVKPFDLALRKFIIAVSDDTEIGEDEYLKNEEGSYTREPVVDTSKLNTTDSEGNLITTATYNHTKEPVLVQKNDIVVYMLRVYNEGEIDGYAGEIKDHLPPYLEFVESDYNKQYGWEISEDGRTVTTTYLKDKLIKKAEIDEKETINLSYQEVPIMCKVVETAPTNENITNIADITEYLKENKEPATDRDSEEDNVKLPKDEDLPSYKDDETGSYIPGQEDDDDFEKVIIKEFDLALRKWVTQAIVIENGQTTVTNTGHDAWDDPEQVVKVELNRKKINQVTVKFRYSIRVYNQGDIAGYAKEVTDYVPQGLKFLAEDNPGWTDEGNNVISTRLLENTLLQPGEYADVEVVLTWINSQDNMGVMTNTAEISEDYNEYEVPDKDSEPNNKKPREDDIDDAPVMLSISTGQMRIYFTLGFTVLITIAGGVLLIKEFVL